MSLPKNLQDCYFYYYSVCRKGTSCAYRHEPTALGHERVCPKWAEGQCFQQNCPERHMVIEKARNQIQCYWEQKPTGCRKPHCVFKHSNAVQVSSNATAGIMTAVNPNVVATALIQMQQQQQQQQQQQLHQLTQQHHIQQHIQQQQQQQQQQAHHLHHQQPQTNNTSSLDQTILDK